ncbi:hypothetical protein P5673_002814 [Acropora cervicornis]|uniref:Uncharacterized protein n=1 Tax=Acropora cervicornis TaxID=6130 RepID=A0AAD9VFD6_ACRCE|nr:hypothetical protein P5673_002814 [Acropora cervicornis]
MYKIPTMNALRLSISFTLKYRYRIARHGTKCKKRILHFINSLTRKYISRKRSEYNKHDDTQTAEYS